MEWLSQLPNEMTFWNWLTLVGFTFALFGTLNAFFGLRGRFQDWRASKSQKSFDDRVTILRNEFTDHELKDTRRTLSSLAYFAAAGMATAILGLAAGIWGIYLAALPLVVFSTEFLFLAVILFVLVARKGLKLNDPQDTVKFLFRLLKKGLAKGFISDVEPITTPIRDSLVWTDKGRAWIESQILELKALSASIAVRKQ